MLSAPESLKQVMVIAFADQVSRVQMLRVKRDAQAQPAELTIKAKRIANLVDKLVDSANPELVMENFQTTFTITRNLWSSELNMDLPDVLSQANATSVKGKVPDPSSLLPEDCDGRLREPFSSMLGSLQGQMAPKERFEPGTPVLGRHSSEH